MYKVIFLLEKSITLRNEYVKSLNEGVDCMYILTLTKAQVPR